MAKHDSPSSKAAHGTATRGAAAVLFARRVPQGEVARRLRISRATASRWHRTWREGGAGALLGRRRLGRPPRLAPAQLAALRRSLLRAPRVLGLPVDAWSLAAVAAYVRRGTGVAFHVRHMARLVRRAGWVVPPLGRFSRHAFCHEPHADPDGNALLFRFAPVDGRHP